MSRFVAHRKSKATLSVPEPRSPTTVLEVIHWPAMTSPYFSPRIAHPLRHPFCRSPRIPRKATRTRYSTGAGNSKAVGVSPAGAEKRPPRGPVFPPDGRTLQEAGKYSPFPSIASHQLSPRGATVTKAVLPVSSATLPVWPGPLPVSKGVVPVSSIAHPVSPALTSTTNKSVVGCLSTDRVTDLNQGTPRRTTKLELLDSISEEKTNSSRSRGSKDLTPDDLSCREGKMNRKQNSGSKEASKPRTAGPNHTKSVDVKRDKNSASDKLTRFSVLKPISPNDDDNGENDSAESEDDVVQSETPEMRSSEVVPQSSKVIGWEKRDRERTTVNVYLPRVELGSSENEDEDD